MRPTIDHLLDTSIQVWRPQVVDDAIGVQERRYSALPNAVLAVLNRASQQEANIGGGLAPVGSLRWYGRPDIDIRPRDVIVILDGPEAGKMFEVNAPPVRPKGHHTQVDCIEWNGQMEEES